MTKMLTETRSIWIDCDPGVDDAIALLLALGSKDLEVIGISTVAGNRPVEQTQRNARQICELAQRLDLKVYAGCPRPLLHPLTCAEQVHGDNGLAGVVLPAPTLPLQPHHGVDALITALLQAPEPLTLATLGPLTNLAVALVKTPEIIPQIAEVVIMGGARGLGNITPAAEFNFFVDPHAAHIVFSSGLPLTLISLEVTHQAIATPERQGKIGAIGNRVSEVIVSMLPHYSVAEQAELGMAGPPLHDPCVIAYLLQPNLFQVRPGVVAIETTSPLCAGRSVIQWQKESEAQSNAQVAVAVDAEGFYELLTNTIRFFRCRS